MKSLSAEVFSTSPYASSPKVKQDMKHKEETPEMEAVRRLTAKYDSYQGLLQAAANRPEASSECAREDHPDSLRVSDEERRQTEAFFRGLKTQVFVSQCMANLYFGTATHSPSPGSERVPPEWELHYTGIPVVLLDTGETRSRRKRRIQILLAERGSCFTLWHDTIDNLTAYKEAGPGFHTMYLSSDHRRVVGLSFDSPEAADELLMQIEELTSRPENISLSAPKSARVISAPKEMKRLPPKSQISQPCCFQHVSSVALADRHRYFSLQTLVPMQRTEIQPTHDVDVA